MNDETNPLATTPPPSLRGEAMFPVLTPAQLARFAARGTRRPIARGDLLFEAGEANVPFFVITAGEVEFVRPAGGTETRVATLRFGQFTGEVYMLSGRRTLIRARVTEAGEVIELDRERLLALVQIDSELSEVLMRAFILRRSELIAKGLGDVVLVGSDHCSGTLRVREFLIRNGHPHTYIDIDRDEGVQELLDRFHVEAADVPVVICRGEVVLRN